MTIGIDGSRAFNLQRTGVEEYSHQVIKQLAKLWWHKEVILYLRKGQEWQIDFPLGKKWCIKFIAFGRFWTQVGLSFEMLKDAPDRLFCPAHTVPLIHPETIMTVHGLEYEHSPKSYSWCSRKLHRFLIKKGCHWAEKIIAVSEKTKEDLTRLYQIAPEKIEVVLNGFSFATEPSIISADKKNYLFFIGRIEERKNVLTVVRVFEILKKEYAYSGKLILAGKPAYGYEKIKAAIEKSKYKKEIVEKGYINDEEKWSLLAGADLMLYPSFSEGFGLPILEAQKAGVPVIASNIPSSQEVAGEASFLFAPEDAVGMAKWGAEILKNKKLREKIIAAGQKNVAKFSWEKCAQETAKVIEEKGD